MIGPSRFPIAEPFVGGLEAHVWLLARTLRARGHQVTLFAAAGSDPAVAQHHRPLASMPGPGGRRRRDLSTDPRLVAAEHRAYTAVLDELAADAHERFDLVHNQSLHAVPVAQAGRLAVPMLTTLHTPPIAEMEAALDRVGPTPNRLMAVSRHTAESWRRPYRPVGVIRNGVDTERWRPGPGGGPLIWFGRLVPEKGAELAIDAARAAGMDLELAGPVADRDYFDRVIAPRLGPTVRYLGHLDQHALAQAVGRACAAVVSPRWDEPYGLVVAESLACGTPVAAFARGGVPESLSADCGRLAPADDIAALARAAAQAAALPRGQARRRALTHCSVTSMVQAYESCYTELLDATRPAFASRPVRRAPRPAAGYPRRTRQVPAVEGVSA